MKSLLPKLLAILVLASCSSPKYSYYFDTHDYNAGKRKKALAENQQIQPVQQSEIAREIPVSTTVEDQVVIASTKREVAKVKSKKILSGKKAEVSNISKGHRKELVKALKSAIRQYKKDSGSLAPDDDGNGGGNQLVALLLAIFLGGLGIHRFYLGRILTGIAMLALLILAAVVPVLIYLLFVWVLIDIILIAMGSLTPASGSYSKPL